MRPWPRALVRRWWPQRGPSGPQSAPHGVLSPHTCAAHPGLCSGCAGPPLAGRGPTGLSRGFRAAPASVNPASPCSWPLGQAFVFSVHLDLHCDLQRQGNGYTTIHRDSLSVHISGDRSAERPCCFPEATEPEKKLPGRACPGAPALPPGPAQAARTLLGTSTLTGSPQPS